jgi:pilus assembly protein CpaC
MKRQRVMGSDPNAISAGIVTIVRAKTTVALLLELGTLLVLSCLSMAAPLPSTLSLLEGKSTVLSLPAGVTRLSVGRPDIVDVILLSPHEVYLLGKNAGSTNVMLWSGGHGAETLSVTVHLDSAALSEQLQALLPEETALQVSAIGESVVLSGSVSDVYRNEQVVAIAQAFLTRQPSLTGNAFNGNLINPAAQGAAVAGTASASGAVKSLSATSIGQSGSLGVGALMGAFASSGPMVPMVTTPAAQPQPHIINLLTLSNPTQVMVEVKVAEVSRAVMEQLGSSLRYQKTNGGGNSGILSNLLSQSPSSITLGNALVATLDGQRSDGSVKILAEPTLLALSGQEAHFLAGGTLYIPTSTPNGAGGSTVTLTEKEYGVSLHFLPKVLEGGRIWLTVAPEVSELNPQGVTVSNASGLPPTVLPSFTTRRASTTVQLKDGEHFIIGGLLSSTSSNTITAMPFLGELPFLGALFRSPDFQSGQSELVFVVTPHIVKATTELPVLPTDHYHEATRSERLLDGRVEGGP